MIPFNHTLKEPMQIKTNVSCSACYGLESLHGVTKGKLVGMKIPSFCLPCTLFSIVPVPTPSLLLSVGCHSCCLAFPLIRKWICDSGLANNNTPASYNCWYNGGGGEETHDQSRLTGSLQVI